MLNEKKMLLRVAEGDIQAFNQLFDQYHQLLALHILRITNSTELAEEVVLDVFMKIWNNRDALATVNNVKAYLYVLSKNHALNCLKQVAKARKLQSELEALADMEMYQAENTDRTEFYRVLDEAIDHLPQQQKTAYLLSRHERLTYVQISTAMGISHETVKTYLKRATIFITTYIQQKSNTILMIALTLFFIFFNPLSPFFSFYLS